MKKVNGEGDLSAVVLVLSLYSIIPDAVETVSDEFVFVSHGIRYASLACNNDGKLLRIETFVQGGLKNALKDLAAQKGWHVDTLPTSMTSG